MFTRLVLVLVFLCSSTVYADRFDPDPDPDPKPSKAARRVSIGTFSASELGSMGTGVWQPPPPSYKGLTVVELNQRLKLAKRGIISGTNREKLGEVYYNSKLSRYSFASKKVKADEIAGITKAILKKTEAK